jgi:hypothetical protein
MGFLNLVEFQQSRSWSLGQPKMGKKLAQDDMLNTTFVRDLCGHFVDVFNPNHQVPPKVLKNSLHLFCIVSMG